MAVVQIKKQKLTVELILELPPANHDEFDDVEKAKELFLDSLEGSGFDYEGIGVVIEDIKIGSFEYEERTYKEEGGE